MNDVFERANSLLSKARQDLTAAQCLARESAVSRWTIGFHAQQAVEKSLKAVLMWHSVRYPFTHDIATLLKLLRLAGLLLPPDADNLRYLTPFAALLRYEDENWGLPASVEVSLLLSSAEKTIAWASSEMKG